MDWVIFALVISLTQFASGIAEDSCDRPEDVKHGHFFLSPHGHELTYVCDVDYQLVGDSKQKCTDGNWSGQPPVCVASNCPQLSLLQHGTIIYDHNMGMASFECKKGFKLYGESQLLCEHQGWNGDLPMCIDANSTPKPMTKHEEMLVNADYSCITKGKVVKPPSERFTMKSIEWAIAKGKPRLYTVYRCMWGYIPVGSDQNLYCKEGQWIGGHPECKYVGKFFNNQDRPFKFDESHISHADWLQLADYSCLTPSESVVSPPTAMNADTQVRVAVLDGMPHMYVQYSCAEGYTLKNKKEEYMYCINKQWMGKTPECVRKWGI